MLEIVIRQSAEAGGEDGFRQVGQLQIDSSWDFDDVMAVLALFVGREIPREQPSASRVDSSGSRPRNVSSFPQEEMTAQPKQEVASGIHMAGSTAQGSPEDLEGFTSKLNIVDEYAVGKRHVLTIDGTIATGNVIAALGAVNAMGGRISKASDIKDALFRDGRFESSAHNTRNAIRHLIRSLKKLGCVSESDGGIEITPLGRKVAGRIPRLPKSIRRDSTHNEQDSASGSTSTVAFKNLEGAEADSD